MNENWSPKEKATARAAFDTAVSRAETEYLQKHGQFPASSLEELWALEKEIREWRKEFQSIFSQYSYSYLMMTFTICVGRGWLKIEELQGLEAEKLARIRRALSGG